MKKEQLSKEIKKAVDWLIDNQMGCSTIKLDNRLAVCVGWLDGYDANDDDVIHAEDDPEYAINAGIKVWTSDDMRTDYEYINMPYYDNGEVLQTDISIKPNEDYDKLAEYLLKEYEGMKDLEIEEDGRIVEKVEEAKELDKSLKESKAQWIYLFPDAGAMGDYKKECKEFNLEYLGKNEFKDEHNLVIKGSLDDLNDYADFLGYDLHPDYLYKEEEFGGDIIEESQELKEEPVYDMHPEYDSRKSFYGKARVEVRDDGSQILWSYDSPVAMIKDGKVILGKAFNRGYPYLIWKYSPTTIRHVKEFLRQNGFKAESTAQIEKDYDVDVIREEKEQKSKCEKLIKEDVEKDYNKLFNEFLDTIEFELVKCDENNRKSTSSWDGSENEGSWALIDLQGGNLADIESDRFENACDIVDRLDVYINDYYLSDEEWGDFDTIEELLANNPDHPCYDILDMIANHCQDVDLEKVYELQGGQHSEVGTSVYIIMYQDEKGKERKMYQAGKEIALHCDEKLAQEYVDLMNRHPGRKGIKFILKKESYAPEGQYNVLESDVVQDEIDDMRIRYEAEEAEGLYDESLKESELNERMTDSYESDNFIAKCEYKPGKYRNYYYVHLIDKNNNREYAKGTYGWINRTWESFQYKTALLDACRKYGLSDEKIDVLRKYNRFEDTLKAFDEMVNNHNTSESLKEENKPLYRVVKNGQGKYFILKRVNDGNTFKNDHSKETFNTPEEAKEAMKDPSKLSFHFEENESLKEEKEYLSDKVTQVLDDYGILYEDIVDNGNKVNIVGVDEEEWEEVVEAIKAELGLEVIVPSEDHEEFDDELVVINEKCEEKKSMKEKRKLNIKEGKNPKSMTKDELKDEIEKLKKQISDVMKKNPTSGFAKDLQVRLNRCQQYLKRFGESVEENKLDDIDAEADNKKELAKKDYEKEIDDADADRDDKLDEDWNDLDEHFDEIREEIVEKCWELCPDCNIKEDDVVFDDSRAWSLYVDGHMLGLPVRKFGAYRNYLGGGVRGSIEHNGREQDGKEFVELGEFFAKKLEEIEELINAGHEGEEWDKPTGVLEKKEKGKGKKELKKDNDLLAKDLGSNYRKIKLKDGPGSTGGISFEGETLGDFLDEVDDGEIKNLRELNKALKDCGIAPIKRLKETWAAEDVIDDLVDRAKAYMKDGEEEGDAIAKAIDDGLIYSKDVYELLYHYMPMSDGELIEKFYDDLYYDISKELEVDEVEERDFIDDKENLEEWLKVKIDEDTALDMLVERVKYWTQEPLVVELYKQMYENYVYDGVFEDSDFDVGVIVDNDYVNYCDVVEPGDEYYEEVLKAYEENGGIGDISEASSYSFIEAVEEEDGKKYFLCRW